MGATLGENLQREWDQEPQAPDLWEALKLIDEDRASGISKLTELSATGSALAMMYMGEILSREEGESSSDVAERWLLRSAEAGSIEGRFQLATHYERVRAGQRAIEEHKKLAEVGYAPAMYLLGSIFYSGTLVDRDIHKAVKFFEQAKNAGHLPAMGYLSWIYRSESFGWKSKLRAHWNCLVKIPAVIWFVARHPHSDRMRGFSLPWSPG
ncbi:tetratricopeptide repeat protein [Sphingopyxis sp.]|uniref:tetratricopeptide repeat protein n=1 Tax=Sphingopyxis sp. TaxID=1908224 RepID=UPI003D0E463E